jgi:hypothetical protein
MVYQSLYAARAARLAFKEPETTLPCFQDEDACDRWSLLITLAQWQGLVNTRRFALGAIFVYQLALLYRFQHGLDLNIGLKAFLKAA